MQTHIQKHILANGLGHRLLCMLPGVVALLATGFDFMFSGQVAALAPVLGAAVLTLLGFMAPVILTAGFNQPMPSSKHLALGSDRMHVFLLWLGFALLFGPSMLRLLGRLVYAV